MVSGPFDDQGGDVAPVWRRPVLALFAAQLAAGAIVFLTFLVCFWLIDRTVPPVWVLLLSQAFLSVGTSRLMGLGWGWAILSAGFALALYGGLIAPVPPWTWLGAALVIALFYRNVLVDRVPLYLTNATTLTAIEALLPDDKDITFVDLGCGFGGVLAHLARTRPKATLIGIESAPIIFFIAKVRFFAFGHENVSIVCGNIRDYPLNKADIVYCFLSPVPMPEMHVKAMRELNPGSVLVSNGFPIPGIAPSEVARVADRRKTTLYLYKI